MVTVKEFGEKGSSILQIYRKVPIRIFDTQKMRLAILIKMILIKRRVPLLLILIGQESADKFIGSNSIEIGYGDHSNGCYLYWKGGSGTTKNAEFRCKKNKGDKFWIKKSGDKTNGYKIGYDNCPLYWSGGYGTTHNGEFRCGSPGDKFWIRSQGDGKWAIGYNNCPLFWRRDSGDVKNAEFRCGKPISDVFWIKIGKQTLKV